MKNILVIGPIPYPINGCAIANQVLLDSLENLQIPYAFINTNTNVISSTQGDKFSIKKMLSFIINFLSIYKIFNCKFVYFTPGLTFYGVLKYAPFILICQLTQKKYVIHIHGNNFDTNYYALSKIKKRIIYLLISKATHGIVLSESLVKNLLPFLPKQNISVINNFVSKSILNERFEKKNTDILKIIYLSNLIIEKGFVDLLDALDILIKRGIKFEAIFAGKIEVEIFNKTKYKFDKLKENVKYIGIVEGYEKKRILNQANVFILPTYYNIEGQPISILEAMATGNIIITTQQGGIGDIISEKNGYFVKKQSPDSIANILEYLSNNLSIEIEKKSYLNYKYIKETYSEEKFFNNIFEIYKKYENNK